MPDESGQSYLRAELTKRGFDTRKARQAGLKEWTEKELSPEICHSITVRIRSSASGWKAATRCFRLCSGHRTLHFPLMRTRGAFRSFWPDRRSAGSVLTDDRRSSPTRNRQRWGATPSRWRCDSTARRTQTAVPKHTYSQPAPGRGREEFTPGPTSSLQLFEQHFRVFKIGGVEAFLEPTVDRGEEGACLFATSLLYPGEPNSWRRAVPRTSRSVVARRECLAGWPLQPRSPMRCRRAMPRYAQGPMELGFQRERLPSFRPRSEPRRSSTTPRSARPSRFGRRPLQHELEDILAWPHTIIGGGLPRSGPILFPVHRTR